MALSEFDIIAKYFKQPGLSPGTDQQALIPLGIGDDCALLALPPGKQLAISMDLLVADVHFPAAADAGLIAQRALSVNLSDLAAMGATPLGFTLGLSLPKVDEAWLKSFSAGLTVSSQLFQCPLVGGDMTQGPATTISIQVHGYLDSGQALKRSGAKVGDNIYVSGDLGGAGLALKLFKNEIMAITEAEQQVLNQAFYQPQPRLNVGQASLGLASAAIDISDGLLADLEHIAKQSGVDIIVSADKVPIASVVEKLAGKTAALTYALSAGDDYELALAIAPQQENSWLEIIKQLNVPLTCIGKVVAAAGTGSVSCVDADGKSLALKMTGYKHF